MKCANDSNAGSSGSKDKGKKHAQCPMLNRRHVAKSSIVRLMIVNIC